MALPLTTTVLPSITWTHLLWSSTHGSFMAFGSGSTRSLLGSHWLQSHANFEVKRVGARAIPRWVTHWEVAREFSETKS
ncbi:hypothetical protein L3X38_005233 [Prunus dulcis]|uniref:Uncharacterized protein n=1 Tax=Prunus dulcis TaxID=3755 RepID=A0AAD4ZQA2_PRUDU|nr:hypothetical protein L3X38_005233 [Prunus dulcis]